MRGQTGVINRSFHRAMIVLGAFLAMAMLTVTHSNAYGAVKVKSDIRYGKPSGQPGSNLLDVYTPSRVPPESRPVVVWIHGGGWFKGDKDNTEKTVSIRVKK